MLQQHTRTTRGLGPVVALGLAIAAINPATGLAKPAGEPFAGTSQQKSTISQNLVSPDARDAGASGSAGTVSSQSLVSPDARDAAAGVVVSKTPAPVAPASVESSGGVQGWDTEVILGLAAALLMGIAGVGLLARARTQHHPRPRMH